MSEMLPDKYGEWRPIPSQPGWWASSRGFVKRARGPSLRRPDLILPETLPTRGYIRAACYVMNITQTDGITKTHSVARLVCEAFHGPPPDGEQWARHKNGNSFDNAADNLFWRHKRSGLPRPKRGRERTKIRRIPHDE